MYYPNDDALAEAAAAKAAEVVVLTDADVTAAGTIRIWTLQGLQP